MIASEPKIVKYLDIPIQHCNDTILKAMNRRDTKAELLEKVGDKMIRTGPEAYTPFRVIINKMPMDEFSCAAEFYCNHSAS